MASGNHPQRALVDFQVDEVEAHVAPRRLRVARVLGRLEAGVVAVQDLPPARQVLVALLHPGREHALEAADVAAVAGAHGADHRGAGDDLGEGASGPVLVELQPVGRGVAAHLVGDARHLLGRHRVRDPQEAVLGEEGVLLADGEAGEFLAPAGLQAVGFGGGHGLISRSCGPIHVDGAPLGGRAVGGVDDAQRGQPVARGHRRLRLVLRKPASAHATQGV